MAERVPGRDRSHDVSPTPTSVFREAGFSVAIWANHLVRAAITAMQQAAAKIHAEESMAEIERQIVPVKEIFRLQNAAELQAAEEKYLPPKNGKICRRCHFTASEWHVARDSRLEDVS